MCIAEIPNMKTDNLTKFIIRCLLAFSLGGVGQVYAQHVCQISLEANPPFPETIASTQVVGTVVYQGQLTWKFEDCGKSSYGQTDYGYTLAAGGPLPKPVSGVAGLTVEAGNPSFTYIKFTSNHFVDSAVLQSDNIYHMSGTFTRGVPYGEIANSFNVSQTITIKASAATVSGRFPDPIIGGTLQDRKTMPVMYQKRCMVSPWIFTFNFSECTAFGSPIDWSGALVGEPQISSVPAVPRIVSGSAASKQNCKPVLSSTITVTNRKTP